ncbi:integrase [Burkholderia sp. WAC0059]|uniref:integrase n=1 Tax=Burkholderia sp. WAC0059 TaxID=2066022 RepID=UPI002154FDDA|nr:integrase [Burkholderia sp. WAC0059]
MWVVNQMEHISMKMLEQRYGRWIKDAAAAPDVGKRAGALFGRALYRIKPALMGRGNA